MSDPEYTPPGQTPPVVETHPIPTPPAPPPWSIVLFRQGRAVDAIATSVSPVKAWKHFKTAIDTITTAEGVRQWLSRLQGKPAPVRRRKRRGR